MASIAVDVMSGDSGAPECVPGALRALVADPQLELILVGKPEIIEPAPGAGRLKEFVDAAGVRVRRTLARLFRLLTRAG